MTREPQFILHNKLMLLIKQVRGRINRIELTQHLRDMRLEIRRTTRPPYNFSYPKLIDKLHPNPKKIKDCKLQTTL
jgi:hypothetical protein